MPIVRGLWLDEPGSCAIPLAFVLAGPPADTRGRWTYSNGNYCSLGLLLEALMSSPLDQAVRSLLFEGLDVQPPHSVNAGALPDDAPYPLGVARLERLGGAGSLVASTDTVARVLATVTAADLDVLRWPGVFVDQYGWGHTGTVDGAKACAWTLPAQDIVVVAVVAGNAPATGGLLCDVVVPALATDLGVWRDKPARTPTA
jgi:CubicO group peptidase (beta-lactamase class C family)